MALLAANVNIKTAPRGVTQAYKAESDEIYGGAFVGLDDSTGYLQPWTDEAGLHWLGLAVERVTGLTTASPIPEVTVNTSGVVVRRINVTGTSAVTHVGDLVYCATDNPADMTLTPTTSVNAIGRVKRWHVSATCDVELYTPFEYANQNASAAITTLTDSTGGSGSHNDVLADGLTSVTTTTKTSAAVTGTLTGTANGVVEDVADIALSTSNTYTDAAVNGAVNAAILGTNLQLKELMTALNEAIVDIGSIYTQNATLLTDVTVQNQNDSDLAQKIIEILSALGGGG